MFAAACPSEGSGLKPSACASHTPDAPDATAVAALSSLRVKGGVRARFHQARGATHISDLGESGGYRLRFPTTHAPHLEAAQINTGGGVAGGDCVAFDYAADAGTDVVVSTQSAERIYRTHGPATEIGVKLRVGPAARLDWLPQSTILFSGARVNRRFDVELGLDSRLLMVETMTFGRIASGEVMGEGAIHDSWRIRRDGRLIFADGLRLAGNIADLLAASAVAGGGRAVALLLYVAPDATDRLEAVRGALGTARSECGVSAWNGMLSARFLGRDGGSVRADIITVVELLARRPLPRVWQA